MFNNRFISCSILAAAVAVSACGVENAPVEPAAMTQTVKSGLRAHAGDGTDLLVEALDGDFVAELTQESCPFFETDACEVPALPFDRTDAEGEIEEFLDGVLQSQNITSQSQTQIAYAINGADICGGDAQCIADINALQLALVVTSPGQGEYDLALTSEGVEVAILHLRTDEVEIELDLGGIFSMVSNHPAIFDVEPADLPDTMAGGIAASIKRESNRRYSGILKVTQNISISGGGVSLEVAASDVLTVTMDSGAQEIGVALDLGSVKVQFPSAWAYDAAPATPGTVEAFLGGLSGSITFSDAVNRLDLNDLGFGPSQSYIKENAQEIATLDLNKNNGRKFDVSISGTADGIAIDVSPSFALEIGTYLDRLAGTAAEYPAWMGNELSSVSLDGASSPGIELLSPSNQARVAAGTVTFDATALAAPRVFTAGECIDSSEAPDNAHPFASLSSAVCQ